jgi:hypothetical protein
MSKLAPKEAPVRATLAPLKPTPQPIPKLPDHTKRPIHPFEIKARPTQKMRTKPIAEFIG